MVSENITADGSMSPQASWPAIVYSHMASDTLFAICSTPSDLYSLIVLYSHATACVLSIRC